MKIEKFDNTTMINMESMHDSIVHSISIKDGTLEINYTNLTKEIFSNDGTPYYKYDNLTIHYKFDTFCTITAFYKRKYKYFDVNSFLKKYSSFALRAYKVYIDNFKELTLKFDVYKKVNNILHSCKLYCVEISLDPKEIIYNWEY